MQRWGWSIAGVLATACLGPLTTDEPGYSRYLLDAHASVPSADKDFELNQKIQLNDGLNPGAVPVLTGYAQGREIHYRDFGEGKAMITPAYALSLCDAKHRPTPNGLLNHPLICDSVPGDADYTPFRALYLVCVTGRYGGEQVPSIEALSDAVEMGLVREPETPSEWLDLPVVASDVDLGKLGADAFYRGERIHYLLLDEPGAGLPYSDKRIKAQNVYELARKSAVSTERVVFAQARVDASGKRNPHYAPAWNVVSVLLTDDAPLDSLMQESDLVSVGADGTVTPTSPWVVSAVPAGKTVNRPHVPEDTQ